jgi:hypothetical protein
MTLPSTRSAPSAGHPERLACDFVTEVKPRPGGQASGIFVFAAVIARARLGRPLPLFAFGRNVGTFATFITLIPGHALRGPHWQILRYRKGAMQSQSISVRASIVNQ